MRQRDRNCVHRRRQVLHDYSPPLLHPVLFLWRIIAILRRMIANSYDFPRKGGERVSEGRGEGNQNKWLSTGFDPICREICVLSALMFVSEHSVQPGS